MIILLILESQTDLPPIHLPSLSSSTPLNFVICVSVSTSSMCMCVHGDVLL